MMRLYSNITNGSIVAVFSVVVAVADSTLLVRRRTMLELSVPKVNAILRQPIGDSAVGRLLELLR
jgi:hypothetical protein